MQDSVEFSELIRRVRAGDEQAATDLVRRFEPEIRREIRLRLTDPRLRRVVESVDICQSVLGNFFARAALGQFEINEPRQLVALLLTMARNKIHDWARKEHADRRDVRREQSLDSDDGGLNEPAAPGPTPSQIVAGKELLDEFRRRLSPEERQIAERRRDGGDWATLAKEFGGTPEALRKRFGRAIDRVARELGLEGAGDA